MALRADQEHAADESFFWPIMGNAQDRDVMRVTGSAWPHAPDSAAARRRYREKTGKKLKGTRGYGTMKIKTDQSICKESAAQTNLLLHQAHLTLRASIPMANSIYQGGNVREKRRYSGS